jgi:tetratricopeptide (TPR) repeat protein
MISASRLDGSGRAGRTEGIKQMTMIWRPAVAALILAVLVGMEPAVSRSADLLPAKGIQRYEELIRRHPDKACYENALGYYHLKAGHLQQAERHLLRAIELEPSYATAHNNLGIIYLRQDKPERAVACFQEAVELDPQYAKARYNLAVALFEEKRYSRALKVYLQARNMDRAYVERRDNRDKLQEALEEMIREGKGSEQFQRMTESLAPSY